MNTTTISDELKTIGLEPMIEKWNKNFNESIANMPEKIPFLQNSFVSDMCKTLKIGEEVSTVMLESLSMFDEKPFLKNLIWHLHYQMFITENYAPLKMGEWADFPANIATNSGMFYAYFFISGYNWLRNKHDERNIPEEITIDLLSDIERWTINHHENLGTWDCNKTGWINNHFDQNIFKIGRLQFQVATFPYSFIFLRNIKNGDVVAFAESGNEFRSDGQFNGCNNILDESAWTSTFTENENTFTGNPVSPEGFAENKTISLPKSEWEICLRKNDNALIIHIPEAGPMTHEMCGESIKGAKEFFAKYFPEYNYKALATTSWILDSQFEKLLKPTSNLVLFLKELYLLPTKGADDTQMLDRVFNAKRDEAGELDLTSLPQKSSMQKAIVKHMEKGLFCRNQSCVFFIEDLDWGNNVYRKMYDRVAK